MIRVVELFSGIGAPRMALMMANIPHQVIAVSEINPHAIDSYRAIYGDCPKIVTEEPRDDLEVRKITPLEAWRLMGFPDWAYEKASKVSTKTQLYSQAGNSIVVVLEEIFKRCFS